MVKKFAPVPLPTPIPTPNPAPVPAPTPSRAAVATPRPVPKGHHLGPVANVTIELPGLVQEYLDQPHDQLLQAPRYLKFLRAFVFQKSLWIVDGGYRSFYGPPQGLYVAGERHSDREFHNLPTPPSKKGDFEVVGCCDDELLVSWKSKDEERFFLGDPRDAWKEIHSPTVGALLLTPGLAVADWTPDSTLPGRYEQPKLLGPSLAASYLPALHGTPGSTPYALRSVHSEDAAVALLCSGHESRASLWMAPSGNPLAGLVAPEGCCFTGRVNSVLFATVDDGTELTAQEFELTWSGSRAHPGLPRVDERCGLPHQSQDRLRQREPPKSVLEDRRNSVSPASSSHNPGGFRGLVVSFGYRDSRLYAICRA